MYETHVLNLPALMAVNTTAMQLTGKRHHFNPNKITGIAFRFDSDTRDNNLVFVSTDSNWDGNFPDTTNALRATKHDSETAFLVMENTVFVKGTPETMDRYRQQFLGEATDALLQDMSEIVTRDFVLAGKNTALIMLEHRDGKRKATNAGKVAVDAIRTGNANVYAIVAKMPDGTLRVKLVDADDLYDACKTQTPIVTEDDGMQMPDGAVLTPVPPGSKAAFGLYFVETETMQWFDGECNQITGTDEVKGAIFPSIDGDGKRTAGSVTLVGRTNITHGLDVDALGSDAIQQVFGRSDAPAIEAPPPAK